MLLNKSVVENTKKMDVKLNVSIVLYNAHFLSVCTLVREVLSMKSTNMVFIIDNSVKPERGYENIADNVKYVYNGKNIGFGAAHNMGLKISIQENTNYHLVLNYDIEFDASIIGEMIAFMENDIQTGLIMPKILNRDGSIQVLPKLLPSISDILIRVLPLGKRLFKRKLEKYTLIDRMNKITNVPIISGCFSLFRVQSLKEIGLYDEKFFMYFEDFDLSRRMHKKYKTVYFPNVEIIHDYQRGATKNVRLFFIYVNSAFHYFCKYGWFFDKDRKKTNEKVLSQLN